jgi:hypothetical protein
MKRRTKVLGGLISAVILFGLLGLVFFWQYLRAPILSAQTGLHSTGPSTVSSDDCAPIDTLCLIERNDSLIKKLQSANIAFSAPPTMNLHDTVEIQLLLSLKTPIEQLKQEVEAAGAATGATVRVSDRMEARLSGSNFAITAITPEKQAVSSNEATKWTWEVKPGGIGHHSLHLTLTALLNIDGTSTQWAIRTFDATIDVEVAWREQVLSFFKKNWQWLWATLLVPIFGWLWNRRKAKGSEDKTG